MRRKFGGLSSACGPQDRLPNDGRPLAQRHAGAAQAVEDDLVALGQEPRGGEVREVAGAVFDLEHPVAVAAVEVVVVVLAGQLVAGGGARQLDRVKAPFIEEATNRAVDRGDAEPWGGRAGGVEDLLGGQRASGGLEGALNGLPLLRLSLHRE